MSREQQLELRRLGADPDVSRMIAIVLERNNAEGVKDLSDDEQAMLIQMARDMHEQLDSPVETPPPEPYGNGQDQNP